MSFRRSAAPKKFFHLGQTRRRLASRQAARRCLAVESLERRQLLAADFFVNDNWNFVSDEDNSLSLTPGDIVDNVNDAQGTPVQAVYGVDAYGEVTTGDFTGSVLGFETIQDALNAAVSGEEVIVLEGAYTEDLTIGVDDITLSGHTGVASDVVITSAGVSNGITISGNAALIRHLQFDSSNLSGIAVSNVDVVTIENVTVENHTNHGIDIDTVDTANLTDVIATGNGLSGLNIATALTVAISGGDYSSNIGAGITIDSATTVDIDGTVASTNGEDGIFVNNATDLIVANVTAETNGQHGIDIDTVDTANLTDVIATGNSLSGLNIATALTVDIAGGDYSSNIGAGITVDSATTVDIDGTVASTNGEDGIFVNNATDLTVANVTAETNGQSGLRGSVISATTGISNSNFNDNTQQGIYLSNVGDIDVSFAAATGNATGVLVTDAASFDDIEGEYNNNDNHGIHLVDIAGNVELLRTTANDNDADNNGTGDGLHAADADLDGLAILGKLTIQGGTFRDTDGPDAASVQIRGIFVGGIVDEVTLENAAAPERSMDVRGNRDSGVVITGNVMNEAVLAGGMYSENAGDGIFLTNFASVTLTGLTASNNGDDGVELSAIEATLDTVTTSANADLGFDASNPGDEGLFQLINSTHEANQNDEDVGGKVAHFATVNFTTTTNPADTQDEVDLTSLQWQHVRAGTQLQHVEYTGATQLNISTLGGDDSVRITSTLDNVTYNIALGDGNDTVDVGDSTVGSRTLANILGNITIDGGNHLDSDDDPTHAALTIKGSSNGPLFIGDTIRFNDQDDLTDAKTYSVTAGTFNRTDIDPVSYSNVETIEVNASLDVATNTIDLTDTVAGGTTTINGGNNVDIVTVTTTGVDSNVTIDTMAGSDSISILSTGSDGFPALEPNNSLGDNDLGSFLVINAGADADIITLQNNGDDSRVEINAQLGGDVIEIWATAAGSVTDAVGGADNDRVEIGNPTAGNRTLDPILGEICVHGMGHDTSAGAPTNPPVTIMTVEHGPLFTGDILNINDHDDLTSGNSYNLGASTFDRNGAPPVTYVEFETVTLNATLTVANSITISGTVAGGTTTIQGGSDLDDVSVKTTGDDSNVIINTAAGADTIFVEGTGADGADDNNSTGSNTRGSFLVVNAGAGEDTLTLTGTGERSFVQLNGQANNDSMHVGNPAAGEQSLDAISITSVIDVDGGSHDAAPTQVTVGPATVTPFPYTQDSTLNEGATSNIPVGDTLQINDRDSHDYQLDSDDVRRIGGPRVEYGDIETLIVKTTTGDDTLTIDMSAGALPGHVKFRAGSGNDSLIVKGSAASDNITVSSNDQGPFSIQGVEFLHLIGSTGHDVLFNRSGAASLLEGDGGNDILVGGSASDAIYAGGGVDALFGRGGDDFLFADVQLKPNLQPEINFNDPAGLGDLLNGGAGLNSAVQRGPNDIIRRITGTLLDGGGRKDVATWLRAQILALTPNTLKNLSREAQQAIPFDFSRPGIELDEDLLELLATN